MPSIMSLRMSFWKLFLLAGGRVKGVGKWGTEAELPSSWDGWSPPSAEKRCWSGELGMLSRSNKS